MKKIFTLIAAALMSVGANAQGKYQIQVDDAPEAGSQITSVPNITMTYGATGAAFKAAKANGDVLKEATNYAAKTDGNGVNPADADDKGFDKGGGVPVKGTFYLFEPTKDGSIEVFFVCNADKLFCILEDGYNIATTLASLNLKAYAEDGSAIDGLTFENGKFNNKVYGTTAFNVKAGKKYHVFCAGSKLGYGGFTYSDQSVAEEDPLGDLPAETEARLIGFGDYDSPATLAESYESGSFKLSRTDTGSKNKIEANNANFGTVESYMKLGTCLKTGGKSSASNALKLTIPNKGDLYVYVREGSDTHDRHLVLTEGPTELYNAIISNENKVSFTKEGADKPTDVYPVVKVGVERGYVNVNYPDGALNFYGFQFVPEGATPITSGISAMKADKVADGAAYNVAGQKVDEGYKGLVIKGGKKMIQK